MASSKPRPRMGFLEAAKRMDKALERETGTPPRSYRPAGGKKQSPPSVTKADLAAVKRLRGKASLH